MKNASGIMGLPEVHRTTALRLFEAFKMAVGEKIAERGTIDAKEFESSYRRFLAMADSFAPLFARVCSECQSNATFAPDPRRQSFLYRFFISRAISLFEPLDKPMRDRLPRHLIPAFGTSFQRFVGPDYFPVLNRESLDLFRFVNTDSDADLWDTIAKDPNAQFMAHRILLRVAQKFRDLKTLGRNFVLDVNGHLGKDHPYRFSEGDFLKIFACAFDELERNMMAKSRNAATIDILFGDGTTDFMRKLMIEFRSREDAVQAEIAKRR